MRIEVATQFDRADPEGLRVRSAFEAAGVPLEEVRGYRAYLFQRALGTPEARRLAEELFTDAVLEVHSLAPGWSPPAWQRRLEVARHPGVMDPVEGTIRTAARDLGIEVRGVKCVRGYWIRGEVRGDALRRAAYKVLANPVIEEVRLEPIEAVPWDPPAARFQVDKVPLSRLSPEALEDLSRRNVYSMNRAELLAVQAHYRALDREPTDVELETIAQTWSEHCSHKTFRGTFRMGPERSIDNLLKQTIMRATREIAAPWCLSVFKDNAGVVELDDDLCVTFKVETHNHPSAIEPFGGAGTGLGGVIRDILGCGLGGKPILNVDVFCVGPLEMPESEIPKGVLHPKRVLGGVIAGVRDYGNPMGIPTPAGAISVHPGYLHNPLVFCGTVGVMPKEFIEKQARAGDLVVAVGGRTGRDGIHGATFSSTHLSEESEEVSVGAVQIGDPITEKKAMDALLAARDERLFTCVTDCGAGGFSSAVGEMAAGLGAEIDLDKAPLKYAGLSYREIWISESQERMILSVPPEKWERLRQLFEAEESEATVLGKFTSDGILRLRFNGTTVAEIDLGFLHEGCPRPVMDATAPRGPREKERVPPAVAPGEALRRVLSGWDACSKEWVIRQYDHEVQGTSVAKPLVGARRDGPGDGCVLTPVLDHPKGIAVGCGLKVRYGLLDPRRMAESAIDEAIRNVVAVGADPSRIALLDNFCWGDVHDPEQRWALVEASEACYATAVGLGTPFVSGKDSLHNTYRIGERIVSIPPTLLVSALGIVNDPSKAVTSDLKAPGNTLYAVGVTRRELGGSQYYAACGGAGGEVPGIDLPKARKTFSALHQAIADGRVRACHDLSEGGLAAALAEMAIGGRLGARVDLAMVPVASGVTRDEEILFSESNTRFLAEVEPSQRGAFEFILSALEVPFHAIGEVTAEPLLRVQGVDGREVLNEAIESLREAWAAPLPRAFGVQP